MSEQTISTRTSPTLQATYAADIGPDFARLEAAVNAQAQAAVATVERLRADTTLPDGERRRRSLVAASTAHRKALDHLAQLNVLAYREHERVNENVLAVVRAHARAHTVAEARQVAVSTLREAGGNLDRAMSFAAAIIEQRDGPLGEALLSLSGAMTGMEPDKLDLLKQRIRVGFAPHEAQRLVALERYFGQLDTKLGALNKSLRLTPAQQAELERLDSGRQHGGT